MAAYIMSDDDLLKIFKEQYSSLINACKLFDSGSLCEAMWICTKIRVLVNDSDKSRSSLTHLDKKNKIMFLDSWPDFDPENLIPTNSLINLCIENGNWFYAAKLNSGETKRVDFDSWRNKIIISDTKNKISRKYLIKTMSNKDGWAHISKDKKLPEGYSEITRANSSWWKITKDGITEELPNIHLFSVRQIGHELLISLWEFFPELEDVFKKYNEHLDVLESIKFEKEAIGNFKEKNYKECIISCDKSLKKNPNNLDVLNGKWMAMAGLGDIDGAINAFLKAKSLEPNIAVLKNLCNAYAIKKDKKNLLENAKMLLLCDPQNKEAIEYIRLCSN